jgi:hypothetical protein
MANTTTATSLPPLPSLEMAWRDVDSSFERFCLTAGIRAIEQMLREDAQQLTGAWHCRGGGRVGHRWGTTAGKIGFHGRPGSCAADLDGGADRGLAWPLGHEPDADQRVDAQAQAGCAAS